MINHAFLLLLIALACGCKRGPIARVIDPNPQFQEAFVMVDHIDFVFPVSDSEASLRNMLPRPKELVATISNGDDIEDFFKSIAFVPYTEGSIVHCECDGEVSVRAYHDDAEVGRFTIHHGKSLRWSPLGTDVRLTQESIDALETCLNEKVYSATAPQEERQIPMLPLRIPPAQQVAPPNP